MPNCSLRATAARAALVSPIVPAVPALYLVKLSPAVQRRGVPAVPAVPVGFSQTGRKLAITVSRHFGPRTLRTKDIWALSDLKHGPARPRKF